MSLGVGLQLAVRLGIIMGGRVHTRYTYTKYSARYRSDITMFRYIAGVFEIVS